MQNAKHRIAVGANGTVARHWLPAVVSGRKMWRALCAVSELVARSCEVVDGFAGQRVTIMRRIGTREVNKYQFMCCWSS